ncbi:MAG: hypothetical protein K0R99_3309 [Microbacterium sp.]|jgi:hypothetical protein|uniref:hypothetical protein n=1 Tax=Microbacterium sp. TaxID=51671 RepID=UPI00262B73EA|nr:hypothetical protein [Microbacterium sp.]MDF2561863.1 hypothetical protein [Microbacterium sp.]
MTATSATSADSALNDAVPRLRPVVLVLAIVAGQLQNVGQTYLPGIGAVALVDDALVIIAFLLSIRFLGRAPGPVSALAISWLALSSAALILTSTFGPASAEIATTMFRQIAAPALLILIGLTLKWQEWMTIARVVVVLGLVNAVYIALETAVGPLVDPGVYAQLNDYRIYADGLPSPYHGNNLITGERITRAGGLLLNPPTMSLFIGVSAVLAFNIYRGWARWMSVAVLLLALYATNGRSGILLAVIGLLGPVLFRVVGAWAAIVFIVIAGVNIGAQIAEHGGSGKHLSGLTAGLGHAIDFPFGRGFGYVGNSATGELIEEGDGGAESLLGIAFSALGMSALILILILVIAYAWLLQTTADNYGASIGLGAVTAALLVESASAVNGTVPIWLAAGLAFVPPLATRLRKGAASAVQ